MIVKETNKDLYQLVDNVDLSLAVSDGTMIFGKVIVNLKEGQPEICIGQMSSECFEMEYGFIIII